MRSFFTSLRGTVSAVTALVEPVDVQEMRSCWNSVQRYFNEVQRCAEDKKMEQLEAQLPGLEAHLDKIVELLAKEQREFVEALTSGASDFPPCYEFFLRGSGGHGSGGGAAHGLNVDPATAGVGTGREMIITVCQYAKHDQPQGTRPMMLRFLTRLFAEADARSGAKSLFHFSNDFVAAPIRDMLVRVSSTLDPWTRGAVASDEESTSQDRVALIKFVATLSARVEAIPSVAAFFIAAPAPGAGSSQSPARDRSTSRASLSSSGEGTRSPLLLLDVLVPYVKEQFPPDVSLSDEDKVLATRHVLQGILCLARTPDPSVAGMVGDCVDIGQIALGHACNLLLTICKAPSNPFFKLQYECVLDLLSFVDEFIGLLPHIAARMGLKSLMTKNFVEETLLPLVSGDSDRVFCAAVTVLCGALRRLRSEKMLALLAEPLLEGAPLKAILKRLSDVNPEAVYAALLLCQTLLETVPSVSMRALLGLDIKAMLKKGLTGIDSNEGSKQNSPTRPPPAPGALLPIVDTREFFPMVLKSDYICGSENQDFVVDTERLMLAVEAALFAEDYQALTALRYHRSHNAGGSTNPKFDFTGKLTDVSYFPTVVESPLISVMAATLGDFTSKPARVNVAWTHLLATICVLPLPGVCHTLLHGPGFNPENATAEGPLRYALSRISQDVLRAFEEDDAKFADSIVSPPSTAGGGGALPANPNELVPSRINLFRFLVKRPFFSSDELEMGSTGAFASAMAKNRSFINACVALEGLRHEVEAALAHLEVSEMLTRMSGEQPRREILSA